VAAAAVPVPLQALTSYDPQGSDRAEHNDSVHLATDRNPSTFWTTDIYRTQDFGGLKKGVGIILDAGKSVAPKQLTVTTDTPGFLAKVQGGDSAAGPFHDVSSEQTVNGTATFTLNGGPARYFVVWVTRLPPGNTAHIDEVTAKR
jgi:putative peptidoglycan lipid II flippase